MTKPGRLMLRTLVLAILVLPAAEVRARALQAVPWWNTAWAHRRPITVTVGATSPMGGYVGYTVRLANLDTAALVTAVQMLASGNDLRIVRWDGAGWTDLPRHVIDMNTAATDVRFALTVDIAASGSDANYYLYYGNPAAGAPPAMTTTNVYLWYDDGSVDRLASYTNGRVHPSGPTNLTVPSSIAYNVGGYFTYDTTDDHCESLRRTGLSERDVLSTYDFYQTGAYPNDMVSGPLVRLTTDAGAPDVETATGFYMYMLGDSAAQTLPYAGHGDIVQSTIATGGGVVAGTAAQVTLNAWHSAGVAAWGVGATNLSGWYLAAPTNTNLGLFGVTATLTGNQSAGDSTAAGQAGLYLGQDIGRVRNILIRRYTSTEPTNAFGAIENVPVVIPPVSGGGGGGSRDDGKCGCGAVHDLTGPGALLAALLAAIGLLLSRTGTPRANAE